VSSVFTSAHRQETFVCGYQQLGFCRLLSGGESVPHSGRTCRDHDQHVEFVDSVADGAPVVTAHSVVSQIKKDLGNFFLGGNKSRYTNKKFPLKKLFPRSWANDARTVSPADLGRLNWLSHAPVATGAAKGRRGIEGALAARWLSAFTARMQNPLGTIV
jgi:hypothetical protein